MINANSGYTPPIPSRQYKNSNYTTRKLLEISSEQNFEASFLHRQLAIVSSIIRRQTSKGKIAPVDSPVAGLSVLDLDFLDIMINLLIEKHYNYTGKVVNICQKQLAEYSGKSVKTVQRRINNLQKCAGVLLDYEGEKYDKSHPLWKEYKNTAGKTRQYFLDFTGLFNLFKEILGDKRTRYHYRKKSQYVNKNKEKPVDNKIITPSNAVKKDRSDEIINNFNYIKKNVFGLFSGTAQKPSTPPPNRSRMIDEGPGDGPDDGAFSDLFTKTVKEDFLKMTEKNQELFLTFKRNQILYYMKRYSAYSTRQERAMRGFQVLKDLAMVVSHKIRPALIQ